MPADDPEDEQAELRAIWDEHRPATLARVAALEHAASLAAEGKLGPAERETARREAHALAGAVAFFGYLNASRMAEDLENEANLLEQKPSTVLAINLHQGRP